MNFIKNIILTFFAVLLFSTINSAQEASSLSKIQQAQKILLDRNELYFSFRVDSRDVLNILTQIISIDNYDSKTGIVLAYANTEEFEKFLNFGIDYQVLLPPSLQTRVLNMATTVSQMASWDRYPTYEVYRAMMKKFEQDYPTLCKLDSIGTTVQGRKLYVLKISDNVSVDEAETEFFYTSTMHGDEATGFILMLRLADYLLSNYGSDSRVNDIVNKLAIYINPDANPDGTYYGGNSSVSGSRRYNYNGYDLNRNFPDPRAGSNPSGAHQPETLAMMAYASSRNFRMSANFHGGIELANYPWDTWTSSTNPHADNNWLYDVSRQYADSAQANSPAGYFTGEDNGVTHGGDWYVVAGGRQDYMNYWHSCREITFEISDTKLISSDLLPAHWNYNKEAMLTYIEHLFTGIQGTVTNNAGDPLDATITIAGHDEDNSFVVTNPLHGNYIRMIENGTWDLTFSADGYQSQTIQDVVVGSSNQPITLNVQLASLSQFPSPTGLAYQISSIKNIDLTWNAPSYSGPLVLEYYNIYRNGSYLAQTTLLSYSDINLNPGNYSYSVRAVYSNPDGESDNSNTVNVNLAYYTITASSGANGSISPSGSLLLSAGSNQNYTFTPLTGYHVNSVLVDGVSVGTPSNYQFSNLLANHTIYVTFAKNVYSITATANNSTYGTISGTGNYDHGETVTLTATPTEYYHFVEWTENGVPFSTNPILSFVASSNRTFVAHFAIQVFNITAASSNAEIGSVSGGGNYYNGQIVNLTAVAITNYHFVNWTENSIEVSVNPNYSFTAISNRNLVANFTIDTHIVTASVVGSGTITPSGDVEVNHGANQSLTFSASPGHYLSNVTVDGLSIGSPSSYTFYNVIASHTIQATYVDTEPIYHVVTITTNNHGSVSPSGSLNVVEGNSASLLIIPNLHYHIGDVTLNGVSIMDDVTILTSGNGTLTLANITANHALYVRFDVDTYTITASAGENGAISPSGALEVGYGEDLLITITPNANFHVSIVMVDGSSVGVVSSYNFQNVTGSHTIHAYFEVNSVIIVATAGTRGSITPSGNVLVDQGSSPSFTISPEIGAYITDVLVDDVSIGAVPTYTFENVTTNRTIEATFALNTYSINATVGENGIISPAGESIVNHGSNLTYTITPDANYIIIDVLVDDQSVGAVSYYTFSSVSANHTIEAIFGPKTYTITASVGTNGSISPMGTSTITHGGSVVYTITPDDNYHVLDVLVDGASVGNVTSYPFENVTANRTIHASFALNTYTITATAGENGTIAPNGNTTKNHGESQSYSITPNVGYHIDDVLVDDISLGPVTNYIFSNITANATIHATFTANLYTLTVSVTGNGSVTANGTEYQNPQTFNYGTSVTLVAIPDNGWEFTGWSTDLSGEVNPVNLILDADKLVTASFVPHVGIHQNNLYSIEVFPNPFQNNLYLKGVKDLKSVRIMNVIGETVLTIEVNNSAELNIQTSKLAEGTYFMILLAKDDKFRVEKLVKVQ